MRNAILSAVVVLGLSVGHAQQDPQYSNFMYDKLSVNPGSAGIHGMYCGTVMYRNQWLGFDGAPKTILLNLDGGIQAIHGGVGLTFYNDKLGFETNNIFRLSYSFHQSSSVGLFGIGLQMGYAGKSFNATWVPIDGPDAAIPGGTDKDGAFDIGFGVYWRSLSQNTYGGLSATHLNGADLADINLDVARHFYLMAGHKQYLPNPTWAIQGDLLTKSDLASTQFDVAVRGWYKDMIYAGVSYRHQDAVYPLVGYHTELPAPEGNCSKMYLTAGLGYDVTLSDIKDYSSGSIDLFVKFCFKPCINPPVPKPIDVRFLGS